MFAEAAGKSRKGGVGVVEGAWHTNKQQHAAPQVRKKADQRNETFSTKVTAVRGWGRGGGRASPKENLK